MQRINRAFRRGYNHFFRNNPAAANVLLLLAELANKKGEVIFETASPESEVHRLLAARFDDPNAYQLIKDTKP